MVRDVCAIQGAWLPMLAPHFFHSRVHADASKRARSWMARVSWVGANIEFVHAVMVAAHLFFAIESMIGISCNHSNHELTVDPKFLS